MLQHQTFAHRFPYATGGLVLDQRYDLCYYVRVLRLIH